ncbi:MAG: 30S ribosomal protein S4 [Verrucomicrobia bacterium]|nr:MAG: 30S ribosomal protein S4 [Verrucomicrobiota bacterium]
MARYTGPKTKVSRRYGVPIFGSSKALERKNYPPGMHGPRGSRRKQSEYAIALGEKQKLRYQYGLLERQFRRIFEKALQKRGVTGETLLQLLETRIDNVVYRLGLANTRSAARQLVSHGHVLVNGRTVNVASYNVKAGDEITIKDKPKSRQLVLRNLDLTQIVPVPDWLTVDRDALSGKVARIPSREEMQPIVNEQLIVELYSRRSVAAHYERRLESARHGGWALTDRPYSWFLNIPAPYQNFCAGGNAPAGDRLAAEAPLGVSRSSLRLLSIEQCGLRGRDGFAHPELLRGVLGEPAPDQRERFPSY